MKTVSKDDESLSDTQMDWLLFLTKEFFFYFFSFVAFGFFAWGLQTLKIKISFIKLLSINYPF